ncbi:MAG: NAD-glutamate dehydrogenase [Alphaproteobacteria bacterium]|nr:NAD-glutamate dehydrogenase [Alphaproteobacteria bacterium]
MLQKIVDACLVKQNNAEQSYPALHSAAFIQFIHKFYANVDVDALKLCCSSYGIDFLAHFVMHAWQLMQQRAHRDSVVGVVDISSLQSDSFTECMSLSNENNLLLVTLINDDRPFLMDSLLLLLKNKSLCVKLMCHPVFRVIRDQSGHLQEIYNAACTPKDKCNAESLISFILHVDKNSLDQEALKLLLRERFSQIISVVDDFSLCRDTLQRVGEGYEALSKSLSFPDNERNQISSSEIGSFLQWLKDHFVFLGARYFKSDIIEKDDKTSLSFEAMAHDTLTENGVGLYRHKEFQTEIELLPIAMRESDQQRYGLGTHMICDPNADADACKPLPFFSIVKSPIRSNVHKYTRIDCIEIMDLDQDGTLCGLYQFIGIFTRKFFDESPFRIPILCNRVRRAFDRFEIDLIGHNGKILTAILATIPHDELFQFDDDGLHAFCAKVLYQKKRSAVNIKVDPLGRFATTLIFLPRDKYSPELKSSVRKYLEKSLNGKVQSEHAHISEQEFARLLVVVGYDSPHEVVFDIEQIESDINALSQTWQERMQNALRLDGDTYIDEVAAFVFPEVYQKIYTPSDGARDLRRACGVKNEPHQRSAAILLNPEQGTFTLQVFDFSRNVSLSELMPIFQNLSLDVLSESDFELSLINESVYLHNFECTMPDGFDAHAANRLIEGFRSVWDSVCENDRFNALIFKSTLTSRDVMVVRAFVRAMRQMQFSASIDYVATILLMYPSIVQHLMDYFKVRFDPELDENRLCRMVICEAALNDALQTITRSDHDRIIRHLFAVIKACVRTNAYQGKTYLSFKFKSEHIPNLPKPVPLFEIFVYTTFMEGVHIRTGKVARGGIRWSDRLEDFRQEVLVLAKTQMIKNSIIIPLGAKGGFVSRRYEEMLAQGVSPALLKQEIVTCYQIFIRGLLDLTDNQKGDICIPPHNVVRHDEDDPYLVVAADKGTASFSDYANALSQEYGFWLDDAFASGGSVGYDHKKMAITSRGAWISVQKHFAELGIDCQETPFTVVGVGDMAGDVFGNGMLRSDKIRLVAAFNHQHIFLDPNPDAKTSFAERQRMFDLPTSTWADYDAGIISKGGGIFRRDVKSILVSKEICTALDLPDDVIEMAPELLIQYILQAKVDLLWFGGIGTYVRSRAETDFDVCDSNNDLLRIEANQLRCRIIGEGANLAMTQKARIEYALLGGRLNTDAIDNSAGVSCSDHEVNIKILFSNLMQMQRITRVERDQLLPEMTDDVAAHVLNDNAEQNRVLTWLQIHSHNDMDGYKQLINILEKNHMLPLNRKLESLPTDQEIGQRAHDQRGLTRSELAVVLAYSKIILFQRLLNGSNEAPMEYTSVLMNYFPNVLQKRFSEEIHQHQLSREIIATILSNQLMNHLGPVDAFEIIEMYDKDVWETIHAYSFVMGLFGSRLSALSAQDPEYDTVLTTRQLMMIYTRNRVLLERLKGEQFDFVSNMDPWFACMPGDALAELFELFCRTTFDKSIQSVKTLSKTYCILATSFGFSDFSELSKKLHLNASWQRQAKTYLLNDWVRLQVKLVKFAHDTEKGRAWINEIAINPEHASRQENLEPVQVLSRVQNGTVKNDLGFMAYFIRYFEHIININ